jgi:hypothetical protein
MDDQYPLLPLGHQIKEHWKEHRPRMYRELEAAGRLDQSVYEAQERTLDAMCQLQMEQKLPYHQAWELIREEWAFLPDEDTE